GAFLKMFEDPGSDWRSEGKRLASYKQVPPLATILPKTAAELSQKELFVSALFCRWVIETAADPHRVFSIARLAGPEQIAKDGLESSMAEVEVAFMGWLSQGGGAR
ncbi:MAG: hypothetical protein VX913_01795, partial [Planctomycetota bacterium]|nr:hypothetical protein [Planctomycetota bacterium]